MVRSPSPDSAAGQRRGRDSFWRDVLDGGGSTTTVATDSISGPTGSLIGYAVSIPDDSNYLGTVTASSGEIGHLHPRRGRPAPAGDAFYADPADADHHGQSMTAIMCKRSPCRNGYGTTYTLSFGGYTTGSISPSATAARRVPKRPGRFDEHRQHEQGIGDARRQLSAEEPPEVTYHDPLRRRHGRRIPAGDHRQRLGDGRRRSPRRRFRRGVQHDRSARGITAVTDSDLRRRSCSTARSPRLPTAIADERYQPDDQADTYAGWQR